MKIGIFSDIHGNIYAFDKVWGSLKKESCDLYLFLGDICGYYYYQNEIIEVLRDVKDLVCIAGNHDYAFLRILRDGQEEKQYGQKYGKANTLLKSVITQANLKFLSNLPKKVILGAYRIALFHGSPWNNLDGYVYPTDSVRRFGALPFKAVLLGHTHYPMHKKSCDIDIINPGSCGQPRDCNRASYAVFDTDKRDVKFIRVSYNTEAMAIEVKRHNEKNKYLTGVLKRRMVC